MLSVSARQVFMYYFHTSPAIRVSGTGIRLSDIRYPSIWYPVPAFSTMPPKNERGVGRAAIYNFAAHVYFNLFACFYDHANCEIVLWAGKFFEQ